LSVRNSNTLQALDSDRWKQSDYKKTKIHHINRINANNLYKERELLAKSRRKSYPPEYKTGQIFKNDSDDILNG